MFEKKSHSDSLRSGCLMPEACSWPFCNCVQPMDPLNARGDQFLAPCRPWQAAKGEELMYYLRAI